jgi:dTDP-4-amino-4,6-dideoxygalactose transaminase
MDDLRSCLGLVQLEKLPERIKRRSEIASRYRKQLSNQKGLRLPANKRKPSSVHHLFVVLLDEGIDRAGFRSHMRKLGVDTSMHYPPVHMFKGFHKEGVSLPVTEDVGKRSVSLPIFNQMSNEQIDYVCDSVSISLGKAFLG